jgi:hypothetical protein
VKIKLLILCFSIAAVAKAQRVDSIYFHLYTDSLKKGQYNYINVDGKMSNGKWLPLTSNEITLTSNHGTFQNNELLIPAFFTPETVTVKAVLKANPAVWKEVVIGVKQKPDPPLLKKTNN